MSGSQGHGMTPEECFWEKVDQNGPPSSLDGTLCWLWTGSGTPRGYGQLRVAGRLITAYRFAYELLVGPVPEGGHLDHRHSCPKSCVNPAHLRVLEKDVAPSQNQQNRGGAQVNSASGIRGVHWRRDRNCWEVQACSRGRRYHGGYFRPDQLAEAAAAAIALRNRVMTHNNADREVTR